MLLKQVNPYEAYHESTTNAMVCLFQREHEVSLKILRKNIYFLKLFRSILEVVRHFSEKSMYTLIPIFK